MVAPENQSHGVFIMTLAEHTYHRLWPGLLIRPPAAGPEGQYWAARGLAGRLQRPACGSRRIYLDKDARYRACNRESLTVISLMQ